MTTAPAVWEVSLSLPDSFQELDLELDPRIVVGPIGAAVDEHLALLDVDVDPVTRADLVERAVATLEQARRGDAVLAALALDVADGLPPLQAYVFEHCVAGPDGTDQGALDQLAATMTRVSVFDAGQPVAEVVGLDDHPAVRCVGLLQVDPAAPSTPLVAARQYWIPVAGTGTLALISCWTPQLHLADELGELFDAIASSVRIS
jgi:hypothetical protein